MEYASENLIILKDKSIKNQQQRFTLAVDDIDEIHRVMMEVEALLMIDKINDMKMK